MARIHGRGSVVYAASHGNSAVPISNAADWSIDVKAGSADVSQLGDDWAQKVRGQLDWSGAMNGPFDTTAANTLWDATISPSGSGPIYIYPNWRNDNGATYYYGNAFLVASVKGGVGAAVTFSASLEGDGPLSVH